jgi:hypothetical protein
MDMSRSSILFNGYCPECALKGKKVTMRLNKFDFFECEETGLQIYLIPSTIAVILDTRGKGYFTHSIKYAHENVDGEYLAPQNIKHIPFVKLVLLFKNQTELAEYINKIII